jgi:beta-N-acetylhexosaminidase
MKAAIVGIAGPALDAAEVALFRAHPPAGVILFARNIETPGQLAGLAAALRAVLPPAAVLLVDQEGGRVARLRPPHWREHPAAGTLGALHAGDAAAGRRAAWLTGALIGLDCAEVFDVVCAPVLDLRLPGAHAGVVGDRAYGADPAAVAALGRACADGLLAAGIQPVMKHMPGHGRARADSHLALPVVTAADLSADMLPFAACAAGPAPLPWAMTAHIVYSSLDEHRAATVSPHIIASVIRGRIGFSGVLVSDDLAMQALDGPPEARARAALAAGCDLAAYCRGDVSGTAAVLEAAPRLTPAAAARMAAARALAAARRTPLDATALAAERRALLAGASAA